MRPSVFIQENIFISQRALRAYLQWIYISGVLLLIIFNTNIITSLYFTTTQASGLLLRIQLEVFQPSPVSLLYIDGFVTENLWQAHLRQIEHNSLLWGNVLARNRMSHITTFYLEQLAQLLIKSRWEEGTSQFVFVYIFFVDFHIFCIIDR